MAFLDSLFNRAPVERDYSDPHLLRVIFDGYSDAWPDNNDRYKGWKPETILTAPKWAIKRALRLAYAEWPQPIDWTVFSAFYMEFVDLAMHLPDREYALVKRFCEGRAECMGIKGKHDPLMLYRPLSPGAVTHLINYEDEIRKCRDNIRRSKAWDPVESTDIEIDEVRQITIDCWIEFAALALEWDLYILSIGRDTYQKSAE